MADDRTIRASKRRRKEARAEGIVARSRELSIALQLLCAVALLFLLGRSLVESLAGMLSAQIQAAGDPASLETPVSSTTVTSQAGQLAMWSSSHILPWLLVPLAVAVVAGLVQIGFLFLPGKAAPRIARLNPVGGLRKIFSLENATGAGLNLLRLFVLLIAAGLFLYSQLPTVVSLVRVPVGQAALLTGGLLAQLGLLLAVCCLLIGAADYGYRRWKYEQDLMMTPEEFRRELRDAEGDPQIRRARRATAQQSGVESTSPVSEPSAPTAS